MYRQELRIIRKEQSTKDGKRTYPRYIALFDKGNGVGYVDVSLTGDTLATFNQLKGDKTYIDVSLSFGEGKKDRDNEEAFIGNLRKKNDDGGYTEVKDRNGNPIPHIVVIRLSKENLLSTPIKLPQKESNGTYYHPSDFFHKEDSKGAVLTNIADSDLPF